jgi:hypothetical protein
VHALKVILGSPIQSSSGPGLSATQPFFETMGRSQVIVVDSESNVSKVLIYILEDVTVI